MNPIDALESVLCDPDGKCCIHGSTEDRNIVEKAITELRKVFGIVHSTNLDLKTKIMQLEEQAQLYKGKLSAIESYDCNATGRCVRSGVYVPVAPANPTDERAKLIWWARERSMHDGMLPLIDIANMLATDPSVSVQPLTKVQNNCGESERPCLPCYTDSGVCEKKEPSIGEMLESLQSRLNHLIDRQINENFGRAPHGLPYFKKLADTDDLVEKAIEIMKGVRT